MQIINYLTIAKVVLIPDSDETLRADIIAIERRFLAPLNMKSTLSHLIDDGDEIFFNILFYLLIIFWLQFIYRHNEVKSLMFFANY